MDRRNKIVIVAASVAVGAGLALEFRKNKPGRISAVGKQRAA